MLTFAVLSHPLALGRVVVMDLRTRLVLRFCVVKFGFLFRIERLLADCPETNWTLYKNLHEKMNSFL